MRQLGARDLPQIRRVWRECFGDSESFLDVYFSSAARPEDGIGLFHGSTLVSNLFELPMRARVTGQEYVCAFVAGCATLPEWRRRHLLGDLMRAALADMRSREVCVSFLHPSRHSFYRKFGYETVNYVQYHTAQPVAESPVCIASTLADVPEESVYASYRAFVSRFNSHFVRTSQRMHAWLELLFSDGGFAAYLEQEERTPYVLFYKNSDGNGQTTADVFELVCDTPEQRTALTTGLGCPARFFEPCDPDSAGAREYTMMRVVCPEIMLQRYPYSRDTSPFVIHVQDTFLEIDYNLEVVPSRAGTSVRHVETSPDITVGISGLAQLLTGTYSPWLFPEALHVFRQYSSCYFDTY